MNYDHWKARNPDDDYCGEPGPPWLCSIYGKECLRDGQECDRRCLREVMSAEDVDEATARGCWKAHQERDQ